MGLGQSWLTLASGPEVISVGTPFPFLPPLSDCEWPFLDLRGLRSKGYLSEMN